MSTAPTSPTTPVPPCSTCGAPLAEAQRYCLNCGARHADGPVGLEALLHRGSPDPTSGPASAPGLGVASATVPRTVSPLGAAAGIGLLLLAVIVGASVGDRDSGAALPQGGAAALATTTPAAGTPVASFTSDWSGPDGWTVQLQVLPKSGTTPEQIAAAKAAATSAGASSVGALDTAAYPTLPPDSYVIYSGVFTDKAAAKAARKALTPSFPDARLAEVSATPKAAESAATGASDAAESKGADEAAKQDAPSSPEEFVKKSKKLPDDDGTAGEAPPKDNAPPGAGSTDEATEIG